MTPAGRFAVPSLTSREPHLTAGLGLVNDLALSARKTHKAAAERRPLCVARKFGAGPVRYYQVLAIVEAEPLEPAVVPVPGRGESVAVPAAQAPAEPCRQA
jgi:hypothetical protein